MPELELALLRRGVHDRLSRRECCSRCRRTPLVGERIYRADGGPLLCELCRPRGIDPPAWSAIVHGPAFGHAIRIIDRHAA
jgi:hypothetical protein